MVHHSINFDRPAFLALLAVIPLLWFVGRRSLSALGKWRRTAALLLRSLVAAAIVLALADVQYQRTSDGLTVVYLLDQSLSIPPAQRQAMLQYVATSLDQHARAERRDRYGVIAFAQNSSVEVPPVAIDHRPPPRIEGLLEPDYSDLATAVRRAEAILPADAAKRIVLVTDGNENAGSLYREARAVADAGVSVDVVPVYLPPRSDVSVVKVEAPPNIRRGQPFDLRVVLDHQTAANDPRPLSGRLQILRKTAEHEETVSDDRISLDPGKRVFTIREELDRGDFYTYEARFVADDATADGVSQNNAASGFTSILGKGRVLFIEDAQSRGQFDYLVDRLRAQDIDVTVTATDRLFNSLVDLQRYDAVVLANVARSSIDNADSTASFTDQQIDMLVQNTRELGCGLVMLGGPDTFGAGGWANTKLEQAMPVDFQIKAAEVIPVGALSIVIDRSGSMQGDKLFMSKKAAIAAIQTMGRRDYISVTAFDAAPTRIVPLQRVGNYSSAARRVEMIGSGGGTDMYPGMVQGFSELRQADAAVKHMIVLTDGQTPAAKFDQLIRDMRKANITVSTIAVGDDANVQLLQHIATAGAGKSYFVRTPHGLPRIFLREVRRVSRPLVYEPPSPVTPIVVGDHEIIRGVAKGFPPVKGLVLTSVKENPLVEVLLRSPQPATEKNATLLATWTYGAGRTAVFTTDAGHRWASAWTAWDGYDKFFSQLVRWSMRPSGDAGNFNLATDVRDGRTQLVLTALDDAAEAATERAVTARAVAPDMSELPVTMEQTAPGRWSGSFPAEKAGSYLVVVNTGRGGPLIRTGVSVGYSPEYRDRDTNLALLESVSALTARGGKPGQLYRQGLDLQAIREPDAINPFRRDLPPIQATQTAWPWFIVAGSCLFWCDVFVRRVQVSLAWLPLLLIRGRDYVRGARTTVAAPVTMDRLRARKRELTERHSATTARFEIDEINPSQPLPSELSTAPLSQTPPASTTSPPEADARPTSYTERLLQAKKQVWRDRDDASPPPGDLP